jgi:hypothetical protein
MSLTFIITIGIKYYIIHIVKYLLQLRQTVFQFCQKELAPKAQEIDQNNEFKELRVSKQTLWNYQYEYETIQ